METLRRKYELALVDCWNAESAARANPTLAAEAVRLRAVADAAGRELALAGRAIPQESLT